jgi:hypothetical protein
MSDGFTNDPSIRAGLGTRDLDARNWTAAPTMCG